MSDTIDKKALLAWLRDPESVRRPCGPQGRIANHHAARHWIADEIASGRFDAHAPDAARGVVETSDLKPGDIWNPQRNEEREALIEHSRRYYRVLRLLVRDAGLQARVLTDKALEMHGDPTSRGIKDDLRLIHLERSDAT